MPAPQFLFAITVAGEAPDYQMLTEIMQSVLGHVGLNNGTIDRLLQELRAQRWALPPGAGCNLRLQRQGHELEIVVSHQGREWRTACAIPD